MIPHVVCRYTELGGGSGGGSGGGIITNPLSKKLFKNTSKLTIAQQTTLEAILNEMKQKLCYAEAMFNHMTSNGTQFNDVKIDPNMNGEAGSVKHGNGQMDLIFRDEEFMNYNYMAHELTHLLQNSLGSYPNSDAKGMMEYERALIDDIMFFAKFNGDVTKITTEDWNNKEPLVWGSAPYGADESIRKEYRKKEEAYKEWIKETTKSGVPSSIPNSYFNHWKSLFYEHSMPYSPDNGYKYNINYTPNTLQKVLNLAVNC